MIRDLLKLLKALISDLRHDINQVELFYIDDTPRALGTKIRRL